MYLDLGRWITGSAFVLEWTPEEASLLQDRPSLLQRQSTSQGNMGNSHQTFCMRLVLVSYVSSTLVIFSCMSMINLSLKIASDTPNHTLLLVRVGGVWALDYDFYPQFLVKWGRSGQKHQIFFDASCGAKF